jgi:hypothetical protein
MALHDLELTTFTGGDGNPSPRDANLEGEILKDAVFSGLTSAEQKAVAITSTLETGRRGGFSGLSGNFDGQGISFGLVNWNLGSGSLQHLLRDFARDFPARFGAVFGPHAKNFEALIRPNDTKSLAAQLAFAIREMNVEVGTKWQVREPWKSYFARLAADTEFQKIQLRYVRDLLARADYFCRYFALKSERAFCFMFDAVSSHGKWWLQKKTKGVERRREILRQKLALLRIRTPFGEIPEDAKLNAIAETLRDVSLDRWKPRVYARKRWFLTGKHDREKELRGLEPRADVPYAVSAPAGPSKQARRAEQELETIDTSADAATRARLLRNTRAGGAAPPRTEQTTAGTTHYVEIPLEIEGKAPPLTGIFIPSGYRHGADVDVILYLHGHKAGHYPDGSSMAIDRYWNERTRPRAALREAVHESGKNVILVAPTLGPKSQAHTLARPGGLDAYLTRVLRALASQPGWQGKSAPQLRHLVLAAHSGGGIWMLSLAKGSARAVAENLRECWGFDCFYHPDIEVAGWPAWARRFPDKKLFAHDATDAIYKGKPIGPRTVAKRLRAKGISNLSLTPAKKQGDHFGVLRDHFLERIAQAPHLSKIPDSIQGR